MSICFVFWTPIYANLLSAKYAIQYPVQGRLGDSNGRIENH